MVQYHLKYQLFSTMAYRYDTFVLFIKKYLKLLAVLYFVDCNLLVIIKQFKFFLRKKKNFSRFLIICFYKYKSLVKAKIYTLYCSDKMKNLFSPELINLYWSVIMYFIVKLISARAGNIEWMIYGSIISLFVDKSC